MARCIGILSAVVGIFLAVSAAHAADGTWTNNANGNWSDTGNWSGATVADGADSTATLTNITANRTVTLDSARTIGNITAADTNANFTISGGNILTLEVTSGSPTIAVHTNRTLTISSAVAGTNGFTKTGDGTATLSGANTIGGDVTVSAGTVTIDRALTFTSLSGWGKLFRMEDNGTLSLLDASAFHGNLRTYAGGNSGHTIQFKSMGDAVGAGNLQTGGGTGDSNQRTKFRLYGDVGPLTLDNRAVEILSRQSTPKNWSGRGTRLENNNATATNTWVINKDLVNETDRDHELELMGTNTGSNEFAGVIGNSTGIGGLGAFYSTQTGILKLLKSGNGKWIVSGNNTYSNGTTVSAGTLVATAANSLGHGNVTLSGGTLELTAAGAMVGATLTVSGGTLVIGAVNAMTNTANLYLPSDASSNLTLDYDQAVAELYLNELRQPNGAYTSSSAWMSGSGTLTVGPASVQPVYWDIDGNAGAGAGSATPSGDWDAATPNWNNAAGIGGAPAVWPAGRTAAFSAGSDATGDYTVTVDSQKDIGGLTFEDGAVVTVTGSTDLRMVTNSLAYVAAAITANVDIAISEDASPRALSKAGEGTLVLSKANTYSGPTTVEAGTLVLSNDNAIASSSDLTIAGGSVDVAATVASTNLILSGKTVTVSGSGTLNFGAGAVIDSDFYHPSNADAGGAVHTISCGISGSPDVHIARDEWSFNDGKCKVVRFAPSSNSTQTLGQIQLNHPGGSQTAILALAGSSTNNTVASISHTAGYASRFVTEGPGKWTIDGNITTSGYPTDWRVEGGTLIVNGSNPSPGALSVENGRLGGNLTYGPASGDATGSALVKSGGILSPGDGGTGTMTFDWGNTSSAPKFNMQDNAIYECDVSVTTNDRIHMSGHSGGVTETLELDNFVLEIRDASGGEAVLARDMPVFTYDADVTVDMAGFGNIAANFDTTALDSYWLTDDLSLVDDAAGTINLSGLSRPPVWNTAVSALAATSATFNATLLNSQQAWDIYAHWGETDGTNSYAAWTNSAYVGSWTNVPATNISYSVSTLSSPQTYYYTFRASNATATVWASPSTMFGTLALPVVNNSIGGVSVTETSATLYGEMIVGGQADAWICWGDNDGGSDSTGDWDNVVSMGSTIDEDVPFSTLASGLDTNTAYSYRCYVLNGLGSDWSDDAGTFSGTPVNGGGGGSGYSMKITFTNFVGRGTLTNFPALVKFTMSNSSDYEGFLDTTDGWDLRFWTNSTLAGDPLNYEIEEFDSSTNSYVWVQIPELTNDVSIWASWGNSASTNQEAYTTNGAVWDANYKGVWHADGTVVDSTTHGNNATADNSVSTDGAIAGGKSFNGSDQRVQLGDLPDFDLLDDMTLSAWVKPNPAASGRDNIFGKWSDGYIFQLYNRKMAVHIDGWQTGNATLTGAQWDLVTMTFDDTANTLRMYLNGQLDKEVLSYNGNSGTGGTLYFGRRDNGEWFQGEMDEFRMSDTVRSTNWIWACYMNQGDSHDSFVEYGPPERGGIANLAPTNVLSWDAVLNGSLTVRGNTNYAVYVHFGTSDGGTNFGWGSGYFSLGSYTNSASTNETSTVSYPKSGLTADTTYWYTFRASNDAGNVWARPSWTFATTQSESGSVFMFR